MATWDNNLIRFIDEPSEIKLKQNKFMEQYYQVTQFISYNNYENKDSLYKEKDFEKPEDAESYLAEQIVEFEKSAEDIAQITGNYNHCEYEDDILDSFDRNEYYTHYRPKLIVKPLH